MMCCIAMQIPLDFRIGKLLGIHVAAIFRFHGSSSETQNSSDFVRNPEPKCRHELTKARECAGSEERLGRRHHRKAERNYGTWPLAFPTLHL
jgi:hypothetical protein